MKLRASWSLFLTDVLVITIAQQFRYYHVDCLQVRHSPGHFRFAVDWCRSFLHHCGCSPPDPCFQLDHRRHWCFHHRVNMLVDSNAAKEQYLKNRNKCRMGKKVHAQHTVRAHINVNSMICLLAFHLVHDVVLSSFLWNLQISTFAKSLCRLHTPGSIAPSLNSKLQKWPYATKQGTFCLRLRLWKLRANLNKGTTGLVILALRTIRMRRD